MNQPMVKKVQEGLMEGFMTDSDINATEYAKRKGAAGKAPLHKISPYFVEEMARVIQMGDEKHKDTPWRKGLPWEEVIGAIKRHVAEIEKGHFQDPESGKSHLAHVAVNAMFLYHFLQGDFGEPQTLPWDHRVLPEGL